MLLFVIIILTIIIIEIYSFIYNNLSFIKYPKKNKKKTEPISKTKFTIKSKKDYRKIVVDENKNLQFLPGEIYTENDSNVFIETKKETLLFEKNVLFLINNKFKIDINFVQNGEKFIFYYKSI